MIADRYPETLRDIYDKIEETIAEQAGASPTVDIPLYVTEWIRKHWSGRTLIPSWWGIERKREKAEGEGELIDAAVEADPVRSMRGRELRAAVWQILALHNSSFIIHPCSVATAIAARVEQEWSATPVYVPKAQEVDRAIRDAAVWRDFAGFSSIGRVVERHGLTQSQIYAISRRLQNDKDLREQPSLPGLENPV